MGNPARVYLGIGSNIGDRERTISEAIERLGEYLDGITMSRIYATLPQYVTDQPDFLNCAVSGDTTYEPRDLLEIIHSIERAAGRDRKKSGRMGPRPIDIDILLYDDRVVREDDLHIPHEKMHERKFVLLPLLELDPQLIDPRDGACFMSRFTSLEKQGIYYHSLKGFGFSWT